MARTRCCLRWPTTTIRPSCRGKVNRRIISSACAALLMRARMLNVSARCRVLMDNFSSQQYDRFESYRRHALPKQAVRKVCYSSLALSLSTYHSSCTQVIQQATGQQVSQSVAQIIAGFSKVFVGEIVEKGLQLFNVPLTNAYLVKLLYSTASPGASR